MCALSVPRLAGAAGGQSTHRGGKECRWPRFSSVTRRPFVCLFFLLLSLRAPTNPMSDDAVSDAPKEIGHPWHDLDPGPDYPNS